VRLEYTAGELVDLQDAFDRYAKDDPSVARRFAAEADKVVQRIVDTPNQFPKVDRKFRRALLTKFPYWVVFEPMEGLVQITAFAHTSRKPDYWRHR
jgi:plasmid stabilization system protein ParE